MARRTSFRAAVGFLTRVPMGKIEAQEMPGAVAWFPIVGLLLGGIAGAVFLGAAKLATPTVAAALAITIDALLTGGFHHDGLADMADGFGGGWTVEQRLEIMKDSRHGTYGVMSLVLVLVLQVSALAALSPHDGLVALIAGASLGRGAAVILLLTMKPARTTGLGVDYQAGVSRVRVAIALVIVGLLTIWMAGLAGLWFIVVAAVGGGAVALLSHRKIHGMAGDVLGAAQQIAFTCVLVAANVIVHLHA